MFQWDVCRCDVKNNERERRKFKEIFIIEKKFYCDLDEWRKYAPRRKWENEEKKELLNMKMKVISPDFDYKQECPFGLFYNIKLHSSIYSTYTFCVRGAS